MTARSLLFQEGTEIILHALLFSLKASSPAIVRSGWPNSHCFQWSEIWSLGMFYVNISLHIFFSFVRVIYSFTSARKVSSRKSYIWCKLERYCTGAEILNFYQAGITIKLIYKQNLVAYHSLLSWICKSLHAACHFTCLMWYIPTLSVPTPLQHQFYNTFWRQWCFPGRWVVQVCSLCVSRAPVRNQWQEHACNFVWQRVCNGHFWKF